MEYLVYILESQKNGRLYIGQTDDLEDRLYRHNTGQSLSTKAGIPWKIIHTESYKTRSEAMKREYYLKSLKNKDYIKQQVENYRKIKQS